MEWIRVPGNKAVVMKYANNSILFKSSRMSFPLVRAFLLFFLIVALRSENTGDNVCVAEEDATELLKIEKFLSWLKQNGAYISPALAWPRYFGESKRRGVLFQNVELLEKEQTESSMALLVQIPRVLFLSPTEQVYTKYENELRVIGREQLFDPQSSHFSRFRLKDILLSLSIFEELSLGENSFYYPYLNILPQRLEYLESWIISDLKLFDDPALSTKVIENAQKLKNITDILFGITQMEKVSRFKYSYYLARTRGYDFLHENERYLFPYLDLFDVSPQNQTTSFLFHPNMTGLQINTSLIQQDHEIFTPLLSYSNLFLLLTQGIILENNPYDAYPLVVNGFETLQDDPFRLKRAEIWKEKYPDGYSILLWKDSPPIILLNFFRLMFLQSEKDFKDFEKVVYSDLEEIVYSACSKLIEIEFGKFKTTLEQDEVDLKKRSWTKAKLLALRYNSERKKILKENLNFCLNQENKKKD